MKEQKGRRQNLTAAILSLSLLMAGLLLYVLGGYVLLFFLGGWTGAIAGSPLIGFANGLGIPFIISTASQRAGKSAATTVMPLISMAMYLAQFVTPMILSAISGVLGGIVTGHLPYGVAMVSAVLFAVWSCSIRGEKVKDRVLQEV